MQITESNLRAILEPVVPLVDFDSDFLFSDLDSLSITAILMTLSEHYHIALDHSDVKPRNFRNLSTLVAMVESKLNA